MHNIPQNNEQAGIVAINVFLWLTLGITKDEFFNHPANQKFKDAVHNTKNLAELLTLIIQMPGKDRITLTHKLLDWLKNNYTHKITEANLADEKNRRLFYNIAIHYVESAANIKEQEQHKTPKAYIQRTLAQLEEKIQLITEFLAINKTLKLNTTNAALRQYYDQTIADINTWLAGFDGEYRNLNQAMFEKTSFDKKMNEMRKIIFIASHPYLQKFIADLDQLNDRITTLEQDDALPEQLKASLRDFYTKKIKQIKEQPQAINPKTIIADINAQITQAYEVVYRIQAIKNQATALPAASSKLFMDCCMQKVQQEWQKLDIDIDNFTTRIRIINDELDELNNIKQMLNSISADLDKQLATLKAAMVELSQDSPYLSNFFAATIQFIHEWQDGFANIDKVFADTGIQQAKLFYHTQYQKLLALLTEFAPDKVAAKITAFKQIKRDILALAEGKIANQYIDACCAEIFSTNQEASVLLARLQAKITQKQQQKQLTQEGYLLASNTIMKEALALMREKKTALEKPLAQQNQATSTQALRELRDTIMNLQPNGTAGAIKAKTLSTQLQLLQDLKPNPKLINCLIDPQERNQPNKHRIICRPANLQPAHPGDDTIKIHQLVLEGMLDFYDNDIAIEKFEQLNTTNKTHLTRAEVAPIQAITDRKIVMCDKQIRATTELNQEFDQQLRQFMHYHDEIVYAMHKTGGYDEAMHTMDKLTQTITDLETQIDKHKSGIIYFFISKAQWLRKLYSGAETDETKLVTQKNQLSQIRERLIDLRQAPVEYEHIADSITLIRESIQQVVNELSHIYAFGPVHFIDKAAPQGPSRDTVVFRHPTGLSANGALRFD